MTSTYRTAGARLRITENLIERASQTLTEHGSPAELIVRDTELKGFVVRLRRSGRHTYGVAYARGKFWTIGGTDRHTAGKARKAAKDALAETALDGVPARA